MEILFTIEDERHSEFHAGFAERSEAIAELERLATIPWDHPPNQAPCTNWRGCGREWEILEHNLESGRRTGISLRIDANGLRWTGREPQESP